MIHVESEQVQLTVAVALDARGLNPKLDDTLIQMMEIMAFGLTRADVGQAVDKYAAHVQTGRMESIGMTDGIRADLMTRPLDTSHMADALLATLNTGLADDAALAEVFSAISAMASSDNITLHSSLSSTTNTMTHESIAATDVLYFVQGGYMDDDYVDSDYVI